MQSTFPQVPAFGPQQVLFPQPTQEQTLHQGSDPNSPEVFNQNVRIVQAHVARLQNLARSALSGVQNAYHPGSNPTQTNADIASLKQSLVLLSDIMRHTGVGALPLLPRPTDSESAELPANAPTEQQMMADATRAVQAQFEQLKRIQDAAGIAANVLSTQDQPASRPPK